MPLKIRGLDYFTAADVTERLQVTRQTLWRWRQEGKIPQGHRFRNRIVVFTPAEVKEIDLYANRIEPIDPPASHQKDLFHDA